MIVPRPSFPLDDEAQLFEYVNGLDRDSFRDFLSYLDEEYHNQTGLISDLTYDRIRSIFEHKFGPYGRVGAEVRGEKAKLPQYMGDLKKFGSPEEIERWKVKYPGPWVVMDKVDGISLMDDRTEHLYTRGNGTYGLNVSNLLAYMKLANSNHRIRGELVMNYDDFELYGKKFEYNDGRSATTAVIKADKSFKPEIAEHLSFYAYRIMDQSLTPEEDMIEAQDLGFKVPNPVIMDDISWEILEDYHHQRVKEAECQIDGQVVYQNVVIDYPDDGPPDQVMAFKVPSPTLETTVTEIRWKVSQYGKVKPVVHYEPVQFPRALLSKASGHNAQYIESHQLGPGAVILVTRQGEANPQIISVLRPSPTGPSLPPEELGYEWNETHTDLLLLQEPEENEEVKTAKLKTFIKSLEIEHVSDKRLSLLVAHGWDTSTRLLRVTPEQLMTIPGIGTKIAQQLVDNLHTKVTNVSLVDIMVASGFFPNIGKKRFLSIVEVYPDFLELMDETTFDQLTQAIRRVPGFNKLADDIAVRVPDFLFWLGQNPMITIAPIEKVEAPLIVEGELKGKNVVFTGFTDRELEAAIKQQGGTVTKTVSGKTNYLIVKSKESASASAQNARAKGIPLMTRDEFVARFFG